MTLSNIDLQARLLTAIGIAPRMTTDQQLVLDLKTDHFLTQMQILKEDSGLQFSMLIDLCGVDYSHYPENSLNLRFSVVYQLLSLEYNSRLRVRTFAQEGDFPVVDSVISLWPCADWYEREAFDLFGIVFQGHPDLRRILTDYGFIGHPFRKDFPLSGHVEMRYDPEQQRVIYQAVSIEEREITPRITREKEYGHHIDR